MPEPEPKRDLIISPEGLSRAQRDGDACVSCRKVFPRPTVRVGRLPSGGALYACPECVPAVTG
jgi:hypothetical protein